MTDLIKLAATMVPQHLVSISFASNMSNTASSQICATV